MQLGRVCASVYVVSQGKTRESGSNKRVFVVLAKQVKSIQKIIVVEVVKLLPSCSSKIGKVA